MQLWVIVDHDLIPAVGQVITIDELTPGESMDIPLASSEASFTIAFPDNEFYVSQVDLISIPMTRCL